MWDENVFTLRGARAHERADEPTTTMTSDGTRAERALPLWSDEHGLVGRADVVEFRPGGAVIPVEYKHGPRRESRHDDLQLCAQALCLEAMLGVSVAEGAVYSVASRRRRAVRLDDGALRVETIATIASVRAMQRSAGPLPAAAADKRCPRCSLKDACLPEALGLAARAARQARNLFIPEPLDTPEGTAR